MEIFVFPRLLRCDTESLQMCGMYTTYR
uniref:Uncharacterized protein n=1 Tax=Anguilla anguilla TaxID=7936 RepID=A0A0E9PTB5_ANGAN